MAAKRFFCENSFPRYITLMLDQAQKNRPVAPGSGGGGDGPSAPKVEKPEHRGIAQTHAQGGPRPGQTLPPTHRAMSDTKIAGDFLSLLAERKLLPADAGPGPRRAGPNPGHNGFRLPLRRRRAHGRRPPRHGGQCHRHRPGGKNHRSGLDFPPGGGRRAGDGLRNGAGACKLPSSITAAASCSR